MSRIVIATSSPELLERVQRATKNSCESLPLGPLPADPAALFAQLSEGGRPDVVVLDADADISQALELASRFDQQCPGISLVLVTDLYLEIGLEAMRVGVRDLLHPAMEGLDISLVLDRAVDAAYSRPSDLDIASGVDASGLPVAGVPVGRIVTVASPKGGVGKTLVATNLAVGLAKGGIHSTVLVDLDLQFGDVASALNLEPEYSLPDALRSAASGDTMVLKTFLTLHETGLYVICGPKSPAAADLITGEQVGQLISLLATKFSFVVVDTSSGLSDHVLAAMDRTSDLVLVTSLDVPGVRGLRKELDALTELALVPDARHVVLNFVGRHGGLTLKDVEVTLGTTVDVSLPRYPAALESVNQGIPLLQTAGRDPLTQGLGLLLRRLAPTASSVVPRRFARRRQTDSQDVALGSGEAATTPRRSRVERAAAASAGEAR